MTSESGKKPYVLRPAQRRYLPVKRALDVILSAVFLAVLAAPMLLLVLVQKLAAPTLPVFFRQQRVGRNGELFTLVKYRTMRAGAHGDVVTGLGRVLRAASIDELPQLLQVLTGKMSLIGPRPLIPQEETVHGPRRAAGIYQLRPGLTGWAQINGRDFVSDEEKVILDREYLENLGLAMDWNIFWRTFGKVLGRKDIRERTDGDQAG